MSLKSVADTAQKSLPSRRKTWSLAARLTAWYTASSFLLVALTTSYLYWAMVANVDREDDELLADKARIVRAVLQRQPGEFAAIRREVEDQWDAQRNERTYVRIIDASGDAVVESPLLQQSLPREMFPAPVPDARAGQNLRTTKGRVFRVLSLQQSGEPWIIHLAMDRSLEEELLEDYQKNLWEVLVVALLICTGVGYAIAHRGLRPVHDIAATAQRIRPTNLSERIQSDDLPAELLALADTFNAMLDRLEQSFARLSRFSADIAHELRTPVHGLRGAVEVALNKVRSPEEYREVLGSNLEECDRLARLIEQLLFLARAENPETHITRDECDMVTELQIVREFFEASAAEAGVTLTTENVRSVHARVDRPLFQRAVGNLVANAIAHTPAGGSVRLAATDDETTTTITVSDSGSGIPVEQLPHVFDRFFRGDRTRSSTQGRAGLGLAIVKSIVELHGGTARITSHVSRGTEVMLSFPRGLANSSDGDAADSVSP